MPKTDRVNIYDSTGTNVAMQIKLNTDNALDKHTLEVRTNKSEHTTLKMNTGKALSIDVQNFNIRKPVSDFGLVIPDDTRLDPSDTDYNSYSGNYYNKNSANQRMNLYEVMKHAQNDIESSSFDNVVNMITHNEALEMNDIQPFNDVGFYGISNPGSLDHNGFDTWEIPLGSALTLSTTPANGATDSTLTELINTISNLNDATKIDAITNLTGNTLSDGTTTKAERLKTMKPFISFDENDTNNSGKVSKAYVTINFEDSDNHTDDLSVLNAAFAETSLIKLEAIRGTSIFGADNNYLRKGMGLPALQYVGGVSVYSATAIDALASEINSYLQLWYNFISQQLIPVNADAIRNNYDIDDTTGLFKQITPTSGGSLQIKGWDIILVDNNDNKATKLFDSLEYSNATNWEFSDMRRGDISTGVAGTFKLTSYSIDEAAAPDGERTVSSITTNAISVSYPDNYIWSSSEKYVWVDELGKVSIPVDTHQEANSGLKRYMVEWLPTQPLASILKGGAIFKITINYDHDGNMDVILSEHIPRSETITSTYDTSTPNKFKNIRNRKFPDANYDQRDDLDKVPFIRLHVTGFSHNTVNNVDGDKPLIWLAMTKNHDFGKIIHEASKEIIQDRSYFKTGIDTIITGIGDGSSVPTRTLQVEQINVNDVDTAMDKFNAGGDHSQTDTSNAVWLFTKAETAGIEMKIDVNPTAGANGSEFGFICVGHNTVLADYNISMITNTLQHRSVSVSGYIYGTLQETWNILLDEYGGTDVNINNLVINLLDDVKAYPYRYVKSPVHHMFNITYTEGTGANAKNISIWLFPIKFLVSTEIQGTTDFTQTFTFHTATLLTAAAPSSMEITGNIGNYIFERGNDGNSTPSTSRDISLLYGRNLHSSHIDYNDSAVTGNQTSLSNTTIQHVVGTGAGAKYYAMFLNQKIDSTENATYVAHELFPDDTNLPGGANELNIYTRNSSNFDQNQDPASCIYFIEQITTDAAGTNTAIASDNSISFTVDGDLNVAYLQITSYNLDTKTLASSISVKISDSKLAFETSSGTPSTINVSNIIASVNELTNDSTDIIVDLTTTNSNADPNGSKYEKLLQMYNNLGLGAKDDALYEYSSDVFNLGLTLSTPTPTLDTITTNSDNSSYPRAKYAQVLSNYSPATTAATFSEAVDISGKLFDNEVSLFSNHVNSFVTEIITKITEFHDALVKGVENGSSTSSQFDHGLDQLGYLWLQEKLTDFLTLMEETTKSQMKSWIDVSTGSISLQSTLENFTTNINKIIQDFMTEFDTLIKYLHEEYIHYDELVEQHVDNIIFHDAIALAMKNIAIDQGDTAPIATYVDNQITDLTGDKFYDSGSQNEWISSISNIDNSFSIINSFTEQTASVTVNGPLEETLPTGTLLETQFKLLQPTNETIRSITSGINPSTNNSYWSSGSDVQEIKVANSFNDLIDADDIKGNTSTFTFSFLQVTYVSGETLIAEAVDITFTSQNLYKLTITNTNKVTTLSDNVDVDIDVSGTVASYKVVGGVARSNSFVIKSSSDIDVSSVTATIPTFNTTDKIEQLKQATLPNVACSIQKYNIVLQASADSWKNSFNDMNSQFLNSIFNSQNSTIFDRLWDASGGNVFSHAARYPTLVRNDTVILDAADTDYTQYQVDPSVIPVTSVTYTSGSSGIVDGTGGPTSYESTPTTSTTNVWNYSTVVGKAAFSSPYAQPYTTATLNSTELVVAIHIVAERQIDPSVNVEFRVNYEDSNSASHNETSTITPTLNTNITTSSVFTHTIVDQNMKAPDVTSVKVTNLTHNSNDASYSIIIETENNGVTKLYTLLRNIATGTGNNTDHNLYALFEGSTEISMNNSYVLPRLSAKFNVQDDIGLNGPGGYVGGTENSTFAGLLNTDLSQDTGLLTILNGFLLAAIGSGAISGFTVSGTPTDATLSTDTSGVTATGSGTGAIFTMTDGVPTAIVNGGSGYAANDTLTINGQTVTVDSVVTITGSSDFVNLIGLNIS